MRGASISIERDASLQRARLDGTWTLTGLAQTRERIGRQLAELARDPQTAWDLRHVSALDSVGAMMLWSAWGRALPPRLDLLEEQRVTFERIAASQTARRSGPAPALDGLAV